MLYSSQLPAQKRLVKPNFRLRWICVPIHQTILFTLTLKLISLIITVILILNVILVLIIHPANGWNQNTNSTVFNAVGEFSPNTENYPSYTALDLENFTGTHAVQTYTGQSDLLDNHVVTIC